MQLLLYFCFIIINDTKNRECISSGQMALSWWSIGQESVFRCREHGLDPCSGKIPHATGQLSPCTASAEPAALEPML